MMNNPINKLHGIVKNVVIATTAIMLLILAGSWLMGRTFTAFDKILFVVFASIVTLQWFIGLMNLGIAIVQEGFQPKWQIEHLVWTSLAIGCLHGASNIPTPENLSRFAVLLGVTGLSLLFVAVAIWRMKAAGRLTSP